METEDLPPKTVKAQLVRLDDNLKRIERTQFAGIQRAPGSLPVLEAFQLFLENERRIAQRRLGIVTAIALLAILLSVVASGLYIRSTLRTADARTDEVARTTEEIGQSLGALAQRQQEADELLARTSQTLAAQQAALTEQAQHLAQEQQTATANLQNSASEVIQLREQLETLLADQESIRRMLTRRTTPPQVSVETAATHTPDLSTTIGPVRSREERDAENPHIEYAIVTLTPEGRTGVRWMLPTVNALE